MKYIIPLLLINMLFSCNKSTQETTKKYSDSTEIKDTIPVAEKTVKQESGSDFSKVYEQHTVDENIDDTASIISMQSGTTVLVRKNTFVYADDNSPVSEPVVIKYREITQASDAVASSVSMIYDSAGVKQNFESAGMFEFKAYSKSSGRLVKFVKGKSVEVEFASNAKTDDYNFYKYDSVARNWTYLSKASSSLKSYKPKKKEDLTEPIKPVRPSKNGVAFDLDIDVDKFPELSSYRGIVWEYASETKTENPAKNKWIFNENWDNIKLEVYSKQSGCYKITLSSKKKSFSTVIKPALTGNDYDLAMQKYQKAMAKYQKSLANNSKVMRLKINDFGIYNIDRIAAIKNQYTLEADFELENGKESLTDKTVYLIYNQNRNVISYTQNGLNTWRKFTFDSKVTDNKLLVIFPENKIAIGNTEDFEIIKKHGHKSYRFKLKILDKPIESVKELNGLF